MSQTQKGPQTVEGCGPSQNAFSRTGGETSNTKSIKIVKEGKLDKMLRLFASGMSFHRFQAERVGDHCVHSSVADLQKRHGIYFDREFAKVNNRFGSQTAVKRYWLEGDNLAKARKICGLEVEGAA